MRHVMKRQHGPLSGGRISEHGLFSGLKCLYWQREWGDVPKAITEATTVVASRRETGRARSKADYFPVTMLH